MTKFQIFLLIMICSELVASSSQMLLKKSATLHYSSWIREYLNKWVITGYFMLFVSMLLTIRGYVYADSYMNVPVCETLGYIFVMIFGRIFFGEKITRNKIIGMIFILAGILVFYT